MDLDVLLLGYLLQFRLDIHAHYHNFSIKCKSETMPYHYYSFDTNNVWGTQMYMISRNNAKKLLDKYSCSYADKTIHNNSMTPFAADWTLTKDGTRAMISPLLAVEDNQVQYDHYGQQQFHQKCFEEHFNPGLFVV
jgi:hypothetical protein